MFIRLLIKYKVITNYAEYFISQFPYRKMRNLKMLFITLFFLISQVRDREINLFLKTNFQKMLNWCFQKMKNSKKEYRTQKRFLVNFLYNLFSTKILISYTAFLILFCILGIFPFLILSGINFQVWTEETLLGNTYYFKYHSVKNGFVMGSFSEKLKNPFFLELEPKSQSWSQKWKAKILDFGGIQKNLNFGEMKILNTRIGVFQQFVETKKKGSFYILDNRSNCNFYTVIDVEKWYPLKPNWNLYLEQYANYVFSQRYCLPYRGWILDSEQVRVNSNLVDWKEDPMYSKKQSFFLFWFSLLICMNILHSGIALLSLCYDYLIKKLNFENQIIQYILISVCLLLVCKISFVFVILP